MMLFSAAFICAAVAAAVFILAAAVRVRAAAAALTVILSGFIMQPDVCYTVLGHLYALIGVGNLIIHIVLSLVGIVRRAGHCAAVCTVAVADFRAYTGIRKVCHTDGVRCSVHNTVVAGNNGLCTHILVFCVVAVLALLYDGKPAIGRLRKDFFLHVMPFQNTALGVIRAVTERAILTAGRCDLVIGTVHIVIVFLFGQFLHEFRVTVIEPIDVLAETIIVNAHVAVDRTAGLTHGFRPVITRIARVLTGNAIQDRARTRAADHRTVRILHIPVHSSLSVPRILRNAERLKRSCLTAYTTVEGFMRYNRIDIQLIRSTGSLHPVLRRIVIAVYLCRTSRNRKQRKCRHCRKQHGNGSRAELFRSSFHLRYLRLS